MRKHDTFHNPPIRRYVSRIKFRIKTEYYLVLLTPELLRLLRSTKSKKTRDENDEDVPHLEIVEVVLVQCNIFNNDHQQD